MKPAVKLVLTENQIQSLKPLFDMVDDDGISAGSIIMQPIRESGNKVILRGAYISIDYALRISSIMGEIE